MDANESAPPLGRVYQVYQWLDASSSVYQVWGDQELEEGVFGRWSPGELPDTQSTTIAGGTLRFDTQQVGYSGGKTAQTLAHELTHAGLRDVLVTPRPWAPGPLMLPPVLDQFLSNALPGGGLPGDPDYLFYGDTPHGSMNLFWLGRFGMK